ncbi:outer membrane beta-barrel protein [Marinobacter sp.]|uniref:outer membrane beta-barrel protein n=1 Tax=Marinobacter sp. TaxID=50741 RepID=UPI0034A2736F
MLLISMNLTAEPVRLSAGFDSRFTDNAGQAATDEQSDLESQLSLGINHTSDPGRCNSELGSRIAYAYWWDETYDPETYASLDFLGDCTIGGGLVWQVSDYLRDVLQDSRSNDNPTNKTRKNIFRTGPIWTYRLGAVDQLSVAAEYENTEFSEPEQEDSERYIGTVEWNHFFSTSFSGGLTASVDRVELDTEEEIDRATASATFDKRWSATRIRGSLGYSQIETFFNSGDNETDAVVGSLEVERDINPTTSLFLEASRELTDQTSDFDVRFGEFVFNLEQTSAVEVSAVRAGLAKEFSAGSSLGINVFANRSDYLDIDREEERVGGTLNYHRPVTPQMTAVFRTGYDYLVYEDEGTTDTLFSVDAGLEFELNRSMTFEGRIGHDQRNSEVVPREFDENWVLFGLNYQFR